MLSLLSEIQGMTPWQVIEEVLARKRPPRGAKWLADQLDEEIQTVSNWKARRVPPIRYREIAKVLGITVDQLEGLEPLPWEGADEGMQWPFSEELRQRVSALPGPELSRLEGVMRAHLGMPTATVDQPQQVASATRTADDEAERTRYPSGLGGTAPKKYAALEDAARYAEDGNASTKDQRPTRGKGGGRH